MVVVEDSAEVSYNGTHVGIVISIVTFFTQIISAMELQSFLYVLGKSFHF